MYQINADGSPFYIGGMQDSRYALVNPQYEQELNKAGQLTFTILPGNKAYNGLNKLTTPVSLVRDGEEIFYGRVYSTEKDFYNRKDVVCEGALAFLNDVIIRPFEVTFKGDDCVERYIDYILDLYNKGCGDENWKKIYTGNVTVTDTNKYLYRYKESYNSAYEVLTDHTIETVLGGYLSTRRDDGKTYLDYTAEPGKTSGQRIEFGKNLLDLSEYITAEDVYTVLIPLGAEDDDGNPLTVKIVNGGLDYIESDEGISLFGRIWHVEEYDEITVATNLMEQARKDLEAGIKAAISIELTAVDLHNIDVDVDAFGCGDSILVVSVPHGINSDFVCNKVNIPLDEPDKSVYSVGVSYKGLSAQVADAQKVVKL